LAGVGDALVRAVCVVEDLVLVWRVVQMTDRLGFSAGGADDDAAGDGGGGGGG
jgi:hypothetical protein